MKGLPLIASFFLLSLSAEACPDFESLQTADDPNNLPKPNLILRVDEPRKNAKEKYVHQIDTNIALVNMTGLLTLRLDCWAPYPIDLFFSGHLTNQETKVKTFRKEYGGTTEQPKSCFLINATMESYEQITGNYTCASVENPRVTASYYIFVSPMPPRVLLNRGQRIVLQPKPEQTHVVFPCAVSHPDVHVKLFRNQRELRLSKDLSYDPKVGFTMKFNKERADVFGRYSCHSELGANDEVEFNLLPPKNFKVSPTVSNLRLFANDHLNISCYGADDIVIVSFPESLPVLKNEVKQVDSSLPSHQYKYVGRFMSNALSPKMSGYVSCNWKETNREFARWSFSVQETAPTQEGQLDAQKLRSACPNVSEMILFECNNIVECRMNSCPRKDPICQSNSQQICTRDKACMQNGLVQCVSDTVSVSEIFFTGYPSAAKQNKSIRYVEWKSADAEELLLINELSPEHSTPKSLKISCQGSNFVFSTGFKWTIMFKNGTKVGVNGDWVTHAWAEKKSTLESKLSIPFDKLSMEISGIECSAPVWNSWTWVSRNITLNMKKYHHSQNKGNTATSRCRSFPVWIAAYVLLAMNAKRCISFS